LLIENFWNPKSMRGSKPATRKSEPSSGTSHDRMRIESWDEIMFQHLRVEVLVTSPGPLRWAFTPIVAAKSKLQLPQSPQTVEGKLIPSFVPHRLFLFGVPALQPKLPLP